MQQLAPTSLVRLGQRPTIPSEQIVLASSSYESPTITLEQHARPAAEHAVPALDEHTLLLLIGQPVRLVQQRDSRLDDQWMGAGQILLVPAGMPTLCRWDDTLNLLHVRIPQRALIEIAAESAFASPDRLELRNHFCARDPQIEALVHALRAEVQSPAIGRRLAIESLTNLLAIQLLRTYSNLVWHESRATRPSDMLLRRVTDHIDDNLHTDLALADLAAVAGVSPYHFTRIFKRATGLTPHQYVIQQRVERAKHMLLSTNQTVVDIAAAVGFYDQGHLSRHMRRLLGTSPQILKNRKNLRS